MKSLASLLVLSFLSACSMRLPATHKDSFNEKMLKQQQAKIDAGEDVYGDGKQDMSSDPVQSSLWAKSVGSPYIIRNQKASKVGDLITIVILEKSTAKSNAKTETKRDSGTDVDFSLKYGSLATKQHGLVAGSGGLKSDFKGEGKTDRTGELSATVQAVVETVLQNGTLFVRGHKIITVNNEDQTVELSGFVRPDDIRINNTVTSELMADARIRYIGDGVVGDKQYVGWGTRLADWLWPF